MNTLNVNELSQVCGGTLTLDPIDIKPITGPVLPDPIDELGPLPITKPGDGDIIPLPIVKPTPIYS